MHGKSSKTHPLLPSSLAFAADVISELSGPLSRRARALLKKGDHSGLLGLEISPSDYVCPSTFRDDYLAVELLSKFPFLSIDTDKRGAALKKFFECELKCEETNIRLLKRPLGFLASVLFTAQRRIQRVLGNFSWDEAELYFAHGPGSTTRLSKAEGHPYFKFQGDPEATSSCQPILRVAMQRVPSWTGGIVVVPGGQVFTVPKKATTDRTCLREPCGNMYLQKGIGKLIRRRLKSVGVNLDDQTLNQRLAKQGSIDGSLATIDLSSASDCVSSRLVFELLPPDWYAACNAVRSHRGLLDGVWYNLHKFSTMGNGFTFELESLIFWAISSSVCELLSIPTRQLGIYGDDIVVPTDAFHRVVEALEYCGFSCNSKKTYSSGPFRESCGKHYFNGVDVSPFYLRKEIARDPAAYIVAVNNLRLFARRCRSRGCDIRFETLHWYLVGLFPSHLRCFISAGFGDGGFISNLDEAGASLLCSDKRRFRYWEGFSVRHLVSVGEHGKPTRPEISLSWLYLREKTGVRVMDEIQLETGSRRLKKRRLLIPRWTDLGPWY